VNGESKITTSHRSRKALIYLRQSTMLQVREHTESTMRQYGLADVAASLGWAADDIVVVDADLGVSGRFGTARGGFAEIVATVCLGQAGAVLGLEVSRLARSSAEFARLLELARLTDTLVIDADGVYDLADINDRLLLGLKGSMSEAELHLLTGRLQGAKKAAAARGELHSPLPVGLVYDLDGNTVLDPDQEVQAAVADVFAEFARTGSGFGVAAAFAGRKFPLRAFGGAWAGQLRWGRLTHARVISVLANPAYAGAYVYGRHTTVTRVQPDGTVRTTARLLPRDQWQVLIKEHHPGFIDWDTYLANQERIGSNTRPVRHNPGTGAVREGCALLQGLAVCGTCGRKLAVFYQGQAKSTPGYYCTGTGALVEGRGIRHLQVGGVAIDKAVAGAFLDALAPAALSACLAAVDELEHGHDTALAGHRRELERTRYAADKAERRYRAVDPENRLVARGLEADWEKALAARSAAETELARREKHRPPALSAGERTAVLALGQDLDGVWSATTTTDKDRKHLLHTLLQDVVVTILGDGPERRAALSIGWKGGAVSELTVPLKRAQPKIRTADDTIDLIRRLAVHHPDATIAGILNRQGRRTARGLSYTASRVQSLRHHWGIDCHQRNTDAKDGELVTVAQAATALGLAPSTLHRWLGDGFIAGEQTTPGAPWRIRLDDALRSMFVDDAPAGYPAMLEATMAHGVSRQALLQRVKRGELQAVHVRTGRRKGLRIAPPTTQEGLF